VSLLEKTVNENLHHPQHHIERLIGFFEQSTPEMSSADVALNSEFLGTLWKMYAALI